MARTLRQTCFTEFNNQKFRRLNERPLEYGYVIQKLLQTWPTSVLDVGTGTTALPAILRTCGFLVTASDNICDYWPDGMLNRHYHVINDDITDTSLKSKFDFICCISVLEHIKEHTAAMENMMNLLHPGGHLAVTCPYNENEYIPNVYALDGAGYGQNEPYICQVYSRLEIDSWLECVTDCRLVDQQYWRVFDGPYWTFGNSISPPIQVQREQLHQHTCMLIRRDTN